MFELTPSLVENLFAEGVGVFAGIFLSIPVTILLTRYLDRELNRKRSLELVKHELNIVELDTSEVDLIDTDRTTAMTPIAAIERSFNVMERLVQTENQDSNELFLTCRENWQLLYDHSDEYRNLCKYIRTRLVTDYLGYAPERLLDLIYELENHLMDFARNQSLFTPSLVAKEMHEARNENNLREELSIKENFITSYEARFIADTKNILDTYAAIVGMTNLTSHKLGPNGEWQPILKFSKFSKGYAAEIEHSKANLVAPYIESILEILIDLLTKGDRDIFSHDSPSKENINRKLMCFDKKTKNHPINRRGG